MILAFLAIALIPVIVTAIVSFNGLSSIRNAASTRLATIDRLANQEGFDANQIADLRQNINQAALDVGYRSQSALTLMIIVTVIITLASGGVAWFFSDQLSSPFEWMSTTALRTIRVLQSIFKFDAPETFKDEINTIGYTLGVIEKQVREEFLNREKQVTMRTGELRQIAQQLQVAAQIAKGAADILDINQLLKEATNLITTQIGFYHAAIYLVDENGEYAALTSAGGDGGRRLLAQSYQMPVATDTIVGYVATTGEAYSSGIADSDPLYKRIPELQFTKSLYVLPLKSRKKVTGVLEVHSTSNYAFTDELKGVLEILANQISVAIENAQLLKQAQTALEAERRAYGELTRAGWEQMVAARAAWGYTCNQEGVATSDGDWHPWMIQAARDKKTLVSLTERGKVVSVPIKVRDQVVGVLDLRKPTAGWSDEEVKNLETISDQMGAALDSARLYQQTQLRAERERLVGEATARMRETLDIETVLRTAVDEIYQKLSPEEVVIRLAQDASEFETAAGPQPTDRGRHRKRPSAK
jgi:GAF domain-containing protein